MHFKPTPSISSFGNSSKETVPSWVCRRRLGDLFHFASFFPACNFRLIFAASSRARAADSSFLTFDLRFADKIYRAHTLRCKTNSLSIVLLGFRLQ